MRWTRASRRRNCSVAEAPAPFYYYEDAQFRDQMNTTARLAGVPIIFGGVARTPEGRPLNSAFFLTTDGHLAGRYDKRFLVPFGEFVPPLFEWVNKVSQEAGDFVPGTRVVTFIAGGHAIGPFICYEAPSRTWCARWPARALKSS